MDGINWSNNFGRSNGPINLPTINTTQQIQAQLPQLGVVYAKGRQGAMDFPCPPNCPGIPIFDSESPTLFVKSTDGYGNASLLEFDVTLRKSQADIQNEAMSAMNARMDKIEEMLTNALSNKSGNGGLTTESAGISADNAPDSSNKRRR